jgi:hypothetical protein
MDWRILVQGSMNSNAVELGAFSEKVLSSDQQHAQMLRAQAMFGHWWRSCRYDSRPT